MSQKTICLVYNTSKYLYLHRLSLLRTLIAMKFKVFVIAPNDNYSDKIKREGVNLVTFKMDRKGMNLFKDFYLCWNIYKAYKKINPDIIHHFTIKPIIYGSIAGRLLGISTIVNSINGLGNYWSQNLIKKKIILTLYRIGLTGDKIKCIFQNKDDMDLFSSNSITSRDKNIVIESCGIDLEYFNSLKYPKKASINKPFKFLFLSRMLFDKGLKELYLASKELYRERKDFEVILAGEIDSGNPLSANQDWLKSISSQKPVKWIGFVDDTPQLIFNADIIILPSYREGFSQSLLEALAMGRPIITTDVPGCRELVKGNGYLVKAKDIEDLKAAMKDAMLSKNKLIQMGQNSRYIALNYDNTSINKKTISFY